MAQKWSDIRRKHVPEVEERIRQKVAAAGMMLLPEARQLTRVLAEADADPRRLTTATLALAEAQRRLGIMNDADYQEIVRGHAKIVRAMKMNAALGTRGRIAPPPGPHAMATTKWEDLKHKSSPEVDARLAQEAHAELERIDQEAASSGENAGKEDEGDAS